MKILYVVAIAATLAACGTPNGPAGCNWWWNAFQCGT
jgi:hypothetical protein